jgi:hypothetical protein
MVAGAQGCRREGVRLGMTGCFDHRPKAVDIRPELAHAF